MKKLLLEIFAMMLVSMGAVYAVSSITRLVLRANGNYDNELMYHISLVAGLCGLILFAILLNIFVIRRLKRLSVGVKDVAKGNYDAVITDKGFDEIHMLTNDFNNMTSELKANEYLNREFVRNVSHELKTPLGCIMGYAELLKNPNRTQSEIKEYSEIIYAEAKRAQKMGSQMLELSRLNSSEHIEQNDTFRVDEQIRKILIVTQNDWVSKNIDMQLDLDEIETVGNENLTYHIWQNLISNAIKFTDDNGTVCIKLKRDNALKFEISNTGKGILPDDQDLIFNQFFTSDNSRDKIGTGLGLPITKKIIEILKGKIGFNSDKGLTTFFVEL